MEFLPCRTTPVNRVRWMASTSSHWCRSWYMAHQAPSYISPSSMPDWKHMLHRKVFFGGGEVKCPRPRSGLELKVLADRGSTATYLITKMILLYPARIQTVCPSLTLFHPSFPLAGCFSIQIQTNLNIQPPSVWTQTHSLVGRGLNLAVLDPQRLQAEGRALCRKKINNLDEISSGFMSLIVWRGSGWGELQWNSLSSSQ